MKVADHARCSVCGASPILCGYEDIIYVACSPGCVFGPERASAEEAWAAWDKLHGPRIPDEVVIPDAVKEIVLSAWAMIGAGERWCHVTLKEAIEECPRDILSACGCVRSGPPGGEDP